ncbi:MAG: acylphosphatase [Candidatus Fimousia sp.]
MKKKRVECHYYGRVQGVGFRYWAQMQGSKFKLTGWVRNEYDGSVTVQAQGTEEQIENFLYGMEHGHRFIRIDELKVSAIPIKEGESDFRVTY